MSENDLDHGLQALQQGNKEAAVNFLSKYVSENPKSEVGWLWLGHSLDDPEKRKYCYQRVLKLAPTNQEALSHLGKIEVREFSHHSELVEKQNPQAETPEKLIKDQKPTKPKKKDSYVMWSLIGFVGLIVLVGTPLLFAASKLQRSSPTPTQIPTRTLSPTPQNTFTPTLTRTPTTIPTITATINLSALATPLIAQAESLFSQSKYSEAIQTLNQAIIYSPNSDKAYYLRANGYYKLLKNLHNLSEYQDYVYSGLADIDQAIALEPTIGDYYALRQNLLISLVGITDYRADRSHLNNISAENALIAWNLGSTLEEYNDRNYVIDLIYAERCEEALPITQQMIKKTDPKDSSITGLYHIQSVAYICLNKVNEAITMVKKSMVNPLGTEYKKYLLASYLYQAGQNKEALEIMNGLIEVTPNYGGERYYLRAAIEYELGEKELAQDDLYTGASNTWAHIGLYSYIMGKLAIDDGRTEEGIRLLQEAEATLEVWYNPLRKKLIAELEGLGVSPLQITPSIMAGVTSIPTVIPQPTSSLKISTPIPGLNYPSGIENAIVFNPQIGAGKIVLKSNDYPLLLLQPIEAVNFKYVRKIIFNVASFTETEPPSIQIYMYDPYQGGWRMISPIWGENEAPSPEDLVYPTGDMIFAIRNYGQETVTIDNLTVTIFLETKAGKILKIGPE